jgi:hypothetical protein
MLSRQKSGVSPRVFDFGSCHWVAEQFRLGKGLSGVKCVLGKRAVGCSQGSSGLPRETHPRHRRVAGRAGSGRAGSPHNPPTIPAFCTDQRSGFAYRVDSDGFSQQIGGLHCFADGEGLSTRWLGPGRWLAIDLDQGSNLA